MKMKLFTGMAALLLVCTLSAMDLKPYKRIVCFGDSITHGGWYSAWLQVALAAEDPKTPRRVINRGIGGYTADLLLKNVDGMLKEDKPDLVFIMVGINDIRTVKFTDKALPCDQAIKKYSSLKHFQMVMGMLVDKLNKAGVKTVILATPPYNESENPGMKAKATANTDSTGVRTLNEIEKRLAAEKKVGFIDVATPMRKNLKDNDARFPRGKYDRIHPSQEEHLIIAEVILDKKLNLTPEQKKYAAQIQKSGSQIQSIRLIKNRVPSDIKDHKAQVRWMKEWAEKMKDPGARKYHSNDYKTLDNADKLTAEAEKKIEETLSKMYSSSAK